MICRDCGQHDAAVLDSRRIYAGAIVRRMRGCVCGAKFSTYEIDGGIWNTVKKWAVSSRLVALKKRQALNHRNQAIVARLKAGDVAQDVAKDFGLSGVMISTIRKRAGLPPARKAKRKTANFFAGL